MIRALNNQVTTPTSTFSNNLASGAPGGNGGQAASGFGGFGGQGGTHGAGGLGGSGVGGLGGSGSDAGGGLGGGLANFGTASFTGITVNFTGNQAIGGTAILGFGGRGGAGGFGTGGSGGSGLSGGDGFSGSGGLGANGGVGGNGLGGAIYNSTTATLTLAPRLAQGEAPRSPSPQTPSLATRRLAAWAGQAARAVAPPAARGTPRVEGPARPSRALPGPPESRVSGRVAAWSSSPAAW